MSTSTTTPRQPPPIPVLGDKSSRGWPGHPSGRPAIYTPLSTALTTRYRTDAHFACYSVPHIERRLATPEVFAQLPDGVTMCLFVVDVDGAEHKGTDAWWAGERAKIDRLLVDHPGAFVYRTRGGYRLIYVLATPEVLRSVADADLWALRYQAWIDYLADRYAIVGDPACDDWTRLFRLPHTTRDGVMQELATIGSPGAVGSWDVAVTVELPPPPPPRTHTYTPKGDDFDIRTACAMEWPGARHQTSGGTTKVHIGGANCINTAAHTSPNGVTDTTILIFDSGGYKLVCQHGHCSDLTRDDVRRYFQPDWKPFDPTAPKRSDRTPSARVTRDRDDEPEADAPQPDPPADSNAARDAPPPAGQHDADSGARAPNAPREPSYRHTQVDNAERFVAANHHRLRYIEKRKQWKKYDGKRWADVGIGAAMEAAKAISEELFAEAGDARKQADGLSAQHAEVIAKATSKSQSGGAKEQRAEAQASNEFREYVDAESEAKQRMAWAKESSYAAALKAMVELASSDPKIAADDDDFDRDLMLLNVQNGTLDLRTGKLREHRPEDMLTRITSCDYKENAPCPTWDDFLATIMIDKTMREWLQRHAGYCLTGLIKEQMLAFFLGIGGNGKNVYTDTLLRIWGDYGTIAAPDLLVVTKNEAHPTGFADLAGRRFVVVSEIDHGREWAESTIKRLTGDDTFKARLMHKDFVTFRNSMKFCIMANSRPVVRDTTRGIWRRMRVAPFETVIEKEDTGLLDRLNLEHVGILAWAVRGCIEWQKNGLPSPEKIARATAKYKDDQDLIGNWIAERCWCTCNSTEREADPEILGVCKTCGSAIPDTTAHNNRTPKGGPWEWLKHIQADVRTWCKERDVKPWGWNSVRAELERRVIGPEKRKRFNVDYRTAESRGVSGMWLRELVQLPGCNCESCVTEAARQEEQESQARSRWSSRRPESNRYPS